MSPFFTLYCVYVCVCVMKYQCQSIWCNALLHKFKENANRLITRIHTSFSAFFRSGVQANCKRFPLDKDLTLISNRDPTRVCHMVLIIFHCLRNNPRIGHLASVFRFLHVIAVFNTSPPLPPLPSIICH